MADEQEPVEEEGAGPDSRYSRDADVPRRRFRCGRRRIRRADAVSTVDRACGAARRDGTTQDRVCRLWRGSGES